MTRVLLTGFEPFDGADRNSSGDAVEAIAAAWDGDAELITAVLPVVYGAAARELLDLVAQHEPDVVIATGVAVGRTAITPERLAANLADSPTPDNAGTQLDAAPIMPSAPDGLFTNLPTEAMVERLRAASVPAWVSMSAGTYVCNDLFFRSLHALEDTGTLVGFVHVPATPEMNVLDHTADVELDVIVKGLRIVIDVALSHPEPADTGPHATEFTLALPPWLVDELASLPTALAEPAEQMALVNHLADRNWREGNGGPFAAIVVDRTDGTVLSVGVNMVLGSGLSVAHAEVMALSLAQRRLGGWDLSTGRDVALVVNWQPCVQCYGAAMWAGVRHLEIAGEGPEVEELTGFDEGPMHADWVDEFARRGITVAVGTGRAKALEVFARFGASDAVVYNASRD